MDRLRGLLPILLLLGSALSFGTFHGGVGGVAVALQTGLVLAFATTAGARCLDPLRLGRAGAGFLWLAWAGVALSQQLSPSPRAGWLVVLLLPAYLLLPAAFARCWASPRARRWGLAGLAGAVAVVAAVALADFLFQGRAQAALPLGHHRLLALWLLLLLPVVAAGAFETVGAFKTVDTLKTVGGFGTTAFGLLILLSLMLGALAVVASRSLLGLAILGVEVSVAVVVVWAIGRGLLLLGGGLVAGSLLFLSWSRWSVVFSLLDSSLQARWVYWQGGWAALQERPWLGFGPGSTPWNLPWYLKPEPGVSPTSELVGDLHSLPLTLAFELGLPLVLLLTTLGAAFWWRRWRSPGRKPLFWGALTGFTGWGLASLGGAPLAVAALPTALAVVFGAALAIEGAGEEGEPQEPSSEQPPKRPPGQPPELLAGQPRRLASRAWALARALAPVLPLAYAVVAGLLLWKPLAAVRAYDAALDLGPAALLEAVELDPHFPLYRARHAALTSDPGQALEAARGAPAVAALRLSAAWLWRGSGREEERVLLEQACRLDPLAAAAPFLRLQASPRDPRAERWAARAFLAEPRLLASPWWRPRLGIRQRAVSLILTLEGVEEGWRQRFGEVAAQVERMQQAAARSQGALPSPSSLVQLAVVADAHPATSLSLHVFRRTPKKFDLLTLDLESELLLVIDLPPATQLPSTAGSLFHAAGCDLGGAASARISKG